MHNGKIVANWHKLAIGFDENTCLGYQRYVLSHEWNSHLFTAKGSLNIVLNIAITIEQRFDYTVRISMRKCAGTTLSRRSSFLS